MASPNLFAADGSRRRRLAAHPEVSRFNDGKVAPRGRPWSAPSTIPRRARALHRLGPSGLMRLKSGRLTSNGLAFSPDGRRLYPADAPRFVVDVHDDHPESGELGAARPFVRFDPSASDRA